MIHKPLPALQPEPSYEISEAEFAAMLEQAHIRYLSYLSRRALALDTNMLYEAIRRSA